MMIGTRRTYVGWHVALCIALAVLATAGCGGGQTRSSVLWHEAEVGPKVTSDYTPIVSQKEFASGGECLIGAVLGEKGLRVDYSIDLPRDLPQAAIVFRYARFHWNQRMVPAEILVTVRGGGRENTVRVVFGDTGGWGSSTPQEWRLVRVDVGDLSAGPLDVSLVSDSATSDVVLDGFFIVPGGTILLPDEFATFGRVAISSTGYVGIELPTSTIDQYHLADFGVVFRRFVGDEQSVTAELVDERGRPAEGALRDLADGEYAAVATWQEGGRQSLRMPVTLIGNLLRRCQDESAALRKLQADLQERSAPATVQDDLRYLIEYTENVTVILRSRTGQEVTDEQLTKAKEYFYGHAAWKTTTARQFAGSLENLFRQTKVISDNVAAGRDAYAGLTGTIRRAFVSESTGKLEEYQFYLPAAYGRGAKLPLLVILAGNEDMIENAPPSKSNETSYIRAVAPPRIEERGIVLLAPKANSDYFGDGQKDLVQVIRLMLSEYPDLDPKRVYCCGASRGGFGTYQLAVDNPDLLAGIACVNGSTGREPNSGLAKAGQLATTRTLIIQGAKDRIVDPADAAALDAELTRLGIEHGYVVLPEEGHGIPPSQYVEMALDYFGVGK